MKVNEIIGRQDRVVYTLMILIASLGLAWSFWQHRHNTAIPGMAAQAHPTAIKAPANNAAASR